MLYTNPTISNLPTLIETVGILQNIVQQFPVIHRGPFTPIVEDEDMSILTRTDAMYSIKPNITRQGALFGWCNDYIPTKILTWLRVVYTKTLNLISCLKT